MTETLEPLKETEAAPGDERLGGDGSEHYIRN